jgi:tRNA uridine 5-carbamoylmethylation protein Kti12
MSTLVITRGLPASGKTTYARKWVAEDRAGRARTNRDDLRQMLDEGIYDGLRTERRVMAARDGMIRALLTRSVDVICDDTNLDGSTVSELRSIAISCGAEFEVVSLLGVPLEECLARNAARTDKPPVPEQWIREQHALHIAPPFVPAPCCPADEP